MSKILLVENDLKTGAILADALKFCGHVADVVETVTRARSYLSAASYELVILEQTLRDGDGLEICQHYRQTGGKEPIFMLSASPSVADIVRSLDAGADDYLVKPFAMTEFQARVNALLRRPVVSYAFSKVGDLELDFFRGLVIRNQEKIQLRAHEMALFEFLIRHPQQAFSAKDLLEKVWSSESNSTEAAVRKTINRIREKIDLDNHSYISCRKNIGYQFEQSFSPNLQTKEALFVGKQMSTINFSA